MEHATEAICPLESVTWIVNGKVPASVGVPLRMPVAASKVRPGGNEPAMIEKTSGGIPPPDRNV
jgi:hypothetical protein